jgi:GNAT superfamily N-acetyltransferase
MTTDSVSIRTFRPSDLEQVKSLFIDGMRANSASEAYIQSSLATDLSSLEDTYLIGRGTFFVIECLEDGKIVGIVGLQDLSAAPHLAREGGGHDNDNDNDDGDDDDVEDDVESKKNMCELRRMSIHSSERRKGRGAQLIEKFIDHSKEHGFDGIVLSTGAWMKEAIEFYISLGFLENGIAKYPIDGKVVEIQKLQMVFHT